MGPSLDEERRRHRHARVIAAAGVVLVTAVLVVVWLVGLVGREVVRDDAGAGGAASAVAPSLPVGPPEPQRLAEAVLGRDEPGLRLQLPIHRDAVTGVGFGSRDVADVVELDPAGERANLSWGRRVLDRFLSTDPPGDLSWFQLDGETPTMVTIGAAAGTDAYAPIEGRVLAIVPHRVSGERHGDVVQLQPLGDAQTVIVLRNLDADPQLQVGQAVSEGATRIGTVRDLQGAVEAPLAAFTHDSGSGIDLYVTRSQGRGDLELTGG